MAEMIIFYTFLSFLAVYGLVSTGLYIRNLFSDIRIMKGKTVFTVIAVKNEEAKVEGMINALLLKAMAGDSGISDSRVIAIDLGSTDKTAEIIKKMENDKKGVSLMSLSELSESIKGSIIHI